ncbi:AraC family transcriptional regulator [Fulvivirgaceae bacterium BMA12]|uniref:AraC family transcriptional regulator n=1 Tax=Agaribacillus aureus TaxID=3051825 RepID=A0ABT8LBR0_9BACT|nr:AraC family transcriptional regulator [Fulvivirgaceae bacterium BMA12]
MLQYFRPEFNKSYTFDSHVLVWIKSGKGLIEVDFQHYNDFQDKLIYLSPGQYVKFVFGDFEVAKLEIPAQYVSKSQDFRVLFKHLVSLGYIQFDQGDQGILNTILSSNFLEILDISSRQWYWQNPFKASKEEYNIIFDVKEVIDEHFTHHLNADQLLSAISHDSYELTRLFKNRVGLTIKNMVHNKLLLESQKDIAFTDKPIQQIAYELGFKDPAYLNRFFKNKTRLTPLEFRRHFGFENRDSFIQDLLELIQNNHTQHHTTSFYAEKIHMSVKTLSRKVKEKLNTTVGQLVRNEILQTAKLMLLQGVAIREVAFELGFEEPNHFSAFFKKYAGITPTDFLGKKYNL